MAKEVKLPPQLEDIEMQVSGPYLKIWKILWAVDPARIKVIPEEKWRAITQLSIRSAIKTAEFQMNLAKNDVAIFKELEKIMG